MSDQEEVQGEYQRGDYIKLVELMGEVYGCGDDEDCEELRAAE